MVCLNNQTRRGFLKGIVATGTATKLFTAAAGDYDEDLAVLLSDVHLCGTGRSADRRFTCGEFDKLIAEILAMRPLPRRVIHFGDLSLANGAVEDYRLAKEKIALLEAAGIEFVHMMGTHDRRGKFASIFPRRDAASTGSSKSGYRATGNPRGVRRICAILSA